jgi:hypothetical protein
MQSSVSHEKKKSFFEPDAFNDENKTSKNKERKKANLVKMWQYDWCRFKENRFVFFSAYFLLLFLFLLVFIKINKSIFNYKWRANSLKNLDLTLRNNNSNNNLFVLKA